MENYQLRLTIFSFVISLLFPMFAYTFTAFGEQPQQFDITLDVNQLESSGIKLSEAQTNLVTFAGPAQEYTVKNQTMRVKWVDRFLLDDYFAFQQQSFIEKVFGSWLVPVEMDVSFNPSVGFITSKSCTNDTIVLNWDPQYNWTKAQMVQNGLTIFVTTNDNNISKAIYETGQVNITVASEAINLNDGNFNNFGNWYLQVVTGQGDDWGMPSFMSWITRIFGFLTLLSGVLMAKEFIPFVN